MEKKIPIFLVCFVAGLVFFCLPLSADPRIDAIRKQYAMVKTMECDDSCQQFRHEIVINTMFPAIGLETMKIRFYHIDVSHPSIDPSRVDQRLVKATVTYNLSDANFYTIEYLFDDEGRLIFYFRQLQRKVNPEADETRYYFDKDELILANVTYHDESGEVVSYTDNGPFKSEKTQATGFVMGKALEYKKLFETLAAAEKLK